MPLKGAKSCSQFHFQDNDPMANNNELMENGDRVFYFNILTYT